MGPLHFQSFFVRMPNTRVHQKVKGGQHYDCGTLLFVSTEESTLDSTNLTAYCPTDSEFATLENIRYVGCVTAVEGYTATAGQKINISADVVIDIITYNEIKADLTKSKGSTTMALPFATTSPQVIQGFGRLELTRRI